MEVRSDNLTIVLTAPDPFQDEPPSAGTPKICGISVHPVIRLFVRGDANAHGGVNITDAIYILNYLFRGGPSPPCREAIDANEDGGVNLTDAVYLLNYLFRGGPPPPAPHPDCGTPGPNADCENFPPCR